MLPGPPTRRVVSTCDSTRDVLACNEPIAGAVREFRPFRDGARTMLESSQAEAYVPARSYPGQPTVLPLGDGPDYSPHGRSRSFRGATMSGIEWDEWKMVEALVRPSHTVLEFGARCAAH